MVGGRGVVLDEQSALATSEAELFVCVEMDAGRRGERSEARVRRASEVAEAWLEGGIEERVEVLFDPERRRVVGRLVRAWEGLPLSEREVPAPAEEAARVLAEVAAERLDEAVPSGDGELAAFRTRVACLARWMPELGLPAWDEGTFRELLPALAAGRRSLEELRKAPWLGALRGLLSPAQLAAVEREAPERIPVPSGSQLRLGYEEGRPPVLAVRIQELFGLAATPHIAGGRVKVLLHLLAPNGRPQQVTEDLAGFWERTYPEVRKELAGRYPKHAWPTDPLRAEPERRPRRKPGSVPRRRRERP